MPAYIVVIVATKAWTALSSLGTKVAAMFGVKSVLVAGAVSKMRFFGLTSSIALTVFSLQAVRAQDLAPRAYIITPLHSNAVTLTWSYYDGSINFNGALPVSDSTGKYSVSVFNYYHSFSFFGRSANVVASLPYGEGNFQGNKSGAEQQVYRSGLLDSAYRFTVNLKGGPAMSPREFVKWKQKVLEVDCQANPCPRRRSQHKTTKRRQPLHYQHLPRR